MKERLFIVLTFISISLPCSGQGTSLTKLYIHQGRATGYIKELRTTLNPDLPIKISNGVNDGYVLVETDADSLGLVLHNGKIAYVHFELGKAYFYRIVSSSGIAYPTMSQVTEQEFWLGVYFTKARYKHYFLGKESKLDLLEESN
ncbi:hypothetical protein [Spirosoma oryzicola]|uniref:hypothetical protein n=1 Tax=Spirosoma oryzicola TaxID=2898794 RepID=UPI001E49511A|nr:hypothetical protein [Spirosoma oryzicola]UHG94640.1 hypothetical protein LQ777_29015 [Spirosoma oryzicola]